MPKSVLLNRICAMQMQSDCKSAGTADSADLISGSLEAQHERRTAWCWLENVSSTGN